nr:uncharacterized protein LOC111517976 [Leptinotarsa decemlineata]
MFARIMAIFSISVVFTDITESAPALAKARQILSEIPGYVPVYIRSGETPLEDINPDLAEAFNFYAQKHGRLAFGRSIEGKSDNSQIKSGSEEDTFSDIDSVSIEEDITSKDDNSVAVPEEPVESKYIQKIPRS